MADQRILIVEDERIAAEDLAALVRNQGYSVIDIIASGEGAVDSARSENPDLILMDIMLQGQMDGITAATRILEDQLIPIIFTTAYGDQNLLERAERETSPYGFIQKPYSDRDIKTTIQLALRRGARDKQVAQMNALLEMKDRISRTIVTRPDSRELLEAIPSELTAANGFSACWIVVMNADASIREIHHSGIAEKQLSKYQKKFHWDSESQESKEIHSDNVLGALTGLSAYRFPFQIDEQLSGFLGIVLKEKVDLDESEQVILQDVANDMSQELYRNELLKKRQAAKEQLAASERQIRAVMDNAPTGIALMGEDFTIEYVNQRVLDITGFIRDELLGKPFTEFIISGLEQAVENYKARRAGKPAESHYELTVRAKSGDEKIIRVSGAIMESASGEVTTISHIEDITESKAVNARLIQLSRAVEQSPASVIITDTDGNIEYVNPKFTATTGYEVEEVLGKNPRILKSGSQSKDYYRELWKTISNGQEWTGELQNRKKSGEIFWESASIPPITSEGGTITHYLAVKEDITQRKLADEILRISEERFRKISGASLDAIVLIKGDGTITFWNEAAVRIFGYTREEILGQNALEVLTPARHLETFTMAIGGFFSDHEMRESERVFEGKGQRKNGDEIYIEIAATLISTDEGDQILGMIRDISQRKEAEKSTERGNKLRNALFNITDAALVVESMDELYENIYEQLRTVVEANSFMIALYEREDTSIRFPFVRDDEVVEMPAQIGFDPTHSLTARTISIGRTVNLEPGDIKKLMEKGEITLVGDIPSNWLGIPLTIEQDVIGCMVLQNFGEESQFMEEDVRLLETAAVQIAQTLNRKRTEREIAESEKEHRLLATELGEANGMKELLLDVITHDLRNPASVISGIVELMEYEIEEQELVEVLKGSSESLLKVIENASVLSKLTLGESITREELDLVAMARETAAEFSSQLETNEMSIELDCPEQALIQANPIISEIIKNYISNAIKYSSDGKKILIRILKQEDRQVLQVIDYGPTIPPDKQQLIFERKVQLSTGVKKGQGLGLAIVKRIADAHEAEVGVEVNEPRGNIFYLKI